MSVHARCSAQLFAVAVLTLPATAVLTNPAPEVIRLLPDPARKEDLRAVRLPESVERLIALQVALDRAGFSPGEIDGRKGRNTRAAVAAAGSMAPAETSYERAVTTYVIASEDAAGPFIDRLPDDLMEQATLPALGMPRCSSSSRSGSTSILRSSRA